MTSFTRGRLVSGPGMRRIRRMPLQALATLGVFAWLCAFHWGSAARAGTISDSLRRALAAGRSSCRVIVYFRNAPGTSDSGAFSRSPSRSAMLTRMRRDNRQAVQAFLTRGLRGLSDFKPLWLVNGASFTADAGVISGLASDPSVEEITLDEKRSLPPVRVDRDQGKWLIFGKGSWTWGLKKIRLPEAREKYGLYGDGVRVGIIDTGCDPNHPDLAGKVVMFKDFCGNVNNPVSYDDQGHGTHCCGTIAGGNAGGRNIGVAPGVKLVVAKALDSHGSGYDSWLLGAMQFMADPDGQADTDDAPAVVNCSWGGPGNDRSFEKAVKAWVELGIFPAFAAGNSGPYERTVGVPGGYTSAFAVGATNWLDKAGIYSSRGPVEWDGVVYVKPDISAPGSRIYSAKAGGGYVKLSGTSMACPHVTGLVALLKQAKPGLGIEEMKAIIQRTAVDLGDPGMDNTFGSGRIDVLAALESALGD